MDGIRVVLRRESKKHDCPGSTHPPGLNLADEVSGHARNHPRADSGRAFGAGDPAEVHATSIEANTRPPALLNSAGWKNRSSAVRLF